MTTTNTHTTPAPARTGRNLALGVVYALLGALGAALVAYAGGRLTGLLGGLLLLVVAVAGLALVVFDAWFVRHRPGVTLADAPSGAPATAFARSPVPTRLSVGVPLVLAAWALGGAALAAADGHPGAAAVLAVVGVAVATPLVAVVRGRVAPGGLYLTQAGIEHRKEAVLWSVPWDDVTGVVPGEPLALLVRSAPREQRTTRALWQREVRAPAGAVGVDSRYLAADAVTVAAVVGRCVADPGFRARMGTAEVVDEIRSAR